MPSSTPPLGQHFLKYMPVAHRIVNLLGPTLHDVILEIGPGRGILTDLLVDRAKHLILIERDLCMIGHLKAKFNHPHISILHNDARNLDIETINQHYGHKLNVISNLPFYAATFILKKLLEQKRYIKQMVLMFQMEVAKRILAKPGSKDYGNLSIFTQLDSIVEMGLFIPKTAFSPQPKVDATVLRLIPYEAPRIAPKNEALFKELIHILFQNRRKMVQTTLKNSPFRSLLTDKRTALIKEHGLELTIRPEQMNIEKLCFLSDILSQK